MPRVSIIVPAYNAARYLQAAIESVVRQTYADWELIVVDDGSTDETPSVVYSYRARLGGKLQYIYQPNRGLPTARNTGIRQAQGEFIAILDADDVWLPARLARGVEVMDSNSDVGLVHSRVARINVDGAIVGYLDFPRKYQAGKIAINIYTRRANILCPTVLFRKRCVDVVGLFDETMGATEDRDLWFRIAERYEIAYVDEILAHSRVTPGSMSSDSSRMLKWQLFFVRKHYARHACGRAVLLRALGQIYREQGDLFFSRGELTRSIGHYSRSVLYNPLNLENVYMLFRASAEPLLSSIRSLRTSRTRNLVREDSRQ
jgi:glycosyltransferase involved in cell wall biosynthesis